MKVLNSQILKEFKELDNSEEKIYNRNGKGLNKWNNMNKILNVLIRKRRGKIKKIKILSICYLTNWKILVFEVMSIIFLVWFEVLI